MNRMQILVPLDGSSLAERALETACTLAELAPTTSTITLLRVGTYPVITMGAESLSPMTASVQIMESEIEEATAYLQVVSQQPRLRSLQVNTRVERGDSAKMICAVAHELTADLVILSTHGRTGLSHLILGSVAESVARDAHLPVLLVHATGEALSTPDGSTPLNIVVPLDGSSLSEYVLGTAIQLARTLHGTITVLRVLPETSSAHGVTKEEALSYLSTWKEQLNALGIVVNTNLAVGDPAQQILATAQRQRGLVALATHGRSGLARWVEGSIAVTLLQRMTLPILIVHPSPETAKVALVGITPQEQREKDPITAGEIRLLQREGDQDVVSQQQLEAEYPGMLMPLPTSEQSLSHNEVNAGD